MFKNIEITKEIIEKVKKELENKPKIIFDKTIAIKSNDIILIEFKREFPKNLLDDIKNFIEHSFYFITLYKDKNILENQSSIIHLIFVYDHIRNYEDENRIYSLLKDIIKNNTEKLNIFNNKIKFYLVHSLPNLNLSILDKLENSISSLNEKNNEFAKLMERQKVQINDLTLQNNVQNNKINYLTSQNNDFANLIAKQNNKINDLTSQNNFLNETIGKLMNRIDDLEKKNSSR